MSIFKSSVVLRSLRFMLGMAKAKNCSILLYCKDYGNQRCYIFKHTSIKTIYLSKKSFGDSTLCHYSVHNEYIQTYLSKKYILKPIFLKYTYWNKCYTLLYIHLHLYIITVHIFKQYFDITVYWKVCLYINSIFKPISAYIQK